MTVGKGQRLLGSHPAEQAAPWAFLPDGTPDDEAARIVAATDAEGEWVPPPHDLRLQAEPTPLDGVVVLKRRLRVLTGTNPANGRPERLMTFHPGTRFSAVAQLVERVPDAFEPLDDCKPPDVRRV